MNEVMTRSETTSEVVATDRDVLFDCPRFGKIFADKENYPGYLEWSLRLTRPGSLILADNVIRDGRVARGPAADPSVRGIQQFNQLLAAHPNLEAILVPVIRRSLDGLAIARVKD